MNKIFFVGLLCLLLFSCKPTPERLPSGSWQFVLELGEVEMPVRAEVSEDDAEHPGVREHRLFFINDDEKIEADAAWQRGDSVFISMPVFESGFKAERRGDSLLGIYYDRSRGDDYAIPFRAGPGDPGCTEQLSEDFGGRWRVYFGENEAEALQAKPSEKAVGVFEQQGNRLTGTFLTETGDYRYLQGCAEGNSLSLSAFDGSHVFHFTASYDAEAEGLGQKGLLKGMFRSGNHWQSHWVAYRDEGADLRDADSLTFLKPGYDRFSFRFPDPQGDTVSLDDARFQDKVVIVQIMGSWCPNCMDETRLYQQWYEQYHEQGLEIVALAFERHADVERAAQAVNRLAEQLGVDYPLLIAGKASKTEAAEKLPMLNHVLSFPTSIFIDKAGKVRKIHTGFYGPGTGTYYEDFVEENEAFIEALLAE
jgi:thiol-disulfide isomerase/thioredoxin